ncbi:MAG: hypothetical protein B7Z80_06990, partial [Rhodospirillales bacterium 20-64-7]
MPGAATRFYLKVDIYPIVALHAKNAPGCPAFLDPRRRAVGEGQNGHPISGCRVFQRHTAAA